MNTTQQIMALVRTLQDEAWNDGKFGCTQESERTTAAITAIEQALSARVPTLWQMRLRIRGDERQGWSAWSECDAASAKAYLASTDEQWEYEVRALYAAPQPSAQREWVGLTHEETNLIVRHHSFAESIVRATEAKIREKNGGAS